MTICKENRINQQSTLPTELDHLQIKTARGYTNSDKDLFKLEILQKGLAGEDKIIEMIEKFGKPNWTILRNKWLKINENTEFEYDIILLTDHGVHPLEIKNYTGKFTYKNGACIENDRKMPFDIIQQARRNTIQMSKLFEYTQNPPQVKGALIFAGENNQVYIQSPVDDIEILKLTDVHNYINRIIDEENNQPLPPIDRNKILMQIKKLEVSHPYPPESLSKSAIQKLRPGIQCARCGNDKLQHTRYYIKCPCGYHESREEAIVRTACDYGVLTHENNFTLGEIMAFIGKQVSKSFVRRTLIKHFKRVVKGKYTYYENKKLPYHKIYHEFKFKYPAMFYTKQLKPNIIVFE
jgi:hypothetical protein